MTGKKKLYVLSFLRIVINVVFILLIIKLVGSLLQITVVMINPDCQIVPFTTQTLFELVPDGEAPYKIGSSAADYKMEMELWVSVWMTPRNRLYILPVSLYVLLRQLMHLFMVFLLRKFFATLQETGPFILQNAIRIRWMGWLIVGAELLRNLVAYLAMFHLKSKVIMQGASISHASFWLHLSELRLDIIFVGVVVLLIAEIFRLGAKMKEEQDLTV